MSTTAVTIALLINEIMASNVGTAISPAYNFDSWIELYNPTEQSINLSGMYLSDDENNLTRWKMPSGVGSVPAKGFKVIWLGSNDLKTTQAPFKLDCDGGTIYLSDQDGSLVAKQQYPEAMSRTAWARKSVDGEEWGWTADATPGESNATAVFASERLDVPVVSEGSKLFTSSLSVKVNIPEGATLMYTTDGSVPMSTTTTSTVRKSTDGKFAVSSTTNYVFRLFKEGYLPSVPVTRSYIKTSNKYTLPIVSIVGDKRYFTDDMIGIDCDGKNGKTGNGQSSPKNYNMDWDRPVNFSFLSSEGEMLFNQDVNIKVSGGWTRAQKYRSFKLKASKAFDGQNRFDYSFFPQKPYIRNKTLLVRNGGNDMFTHNSRFMDGALETIIQRSGIDVDVQSYVPIIEYVNGQLRGVLNLREPNNDDFAYANWGYDDEELDAFENLEMKNGDDVVLMRIFELAKQINAEGAYEELKTLLDIDEFTNYMAVTMFLDNDDWPNNNMKAYRSRKDGRYRFVSFDLDYAFGLRNFNKHNDDPFAYFLDFKDASTVQYEQNRNREVVRLMLNLLGHNEFRRKFIDTFCLVAGSVFEPTRADAIVDELWNNVKGMCELMEGQGITDGHRSKDSYGFWGGGLTSATEIKNKLEGRSKKMAGHLKNFSYAKLTTSAQGVTLKTDAEGARLFVNGIEVPYADFNGHLFAPVTLRAEAPAGYRFAGWKKGSSIVSTETEMSLPTGTVNLVASFTKLSDNEKAQQGITPVRINEVSADDGVYVNDYFKRNDWVELYNTTDQPIDVEGMFLTDNPDKPKKYQISKGVSQASTVIPAHGYLIIWCDKLEPQSQLHASFKLDDEGDELQLMAADGSWTDRFVYAAHESDQTVGRYPDGSNQVYVMNIPTIAKPNIFSSYVVDVEQPVITGISEMMAEQLQDSERIYNLKGQAVREGTLSSGIYIKNGRKFIKK